MDIFGFLQFFGTGFAITAITLAPVVVAVLLVAIGDAID